MIFTIRWLSSRVSDYIMMLAPRNLMRAYVWVPYLFRKSLAIPDRTQEHPIEQAINPIGRDPTINPKP